MLYFLCISRIIIVYIYIYIYKGKNKNKTAHKKKSPKSKRILLVTQVCFIETKVRQVKFFNSSASGKTKFSLNDNLKDIIINQFKSNVKQCISQNVLFCE